MVCLSVLLQLLLVPRSVSFLHSFDADRYLIAMADDFTIEAFTLLGIAIVAIVIRIVARWLTAGPKNFQLDDYLMPLAGVFSSSTPAGSVLRVV